MSPGRVRSLSELGDLIEQNRLDHEGDLRGIKESVEKLDVKLTRIYVAIGGLGLSIIGGFVTAMVRMH